MRKCLLLVAALLIGSGCSEDAVDGDQVAGTASAGGNPLALTFAYRTDNSRESLEWEPPTLNIGEMRVAIGGDNWSCSIASAQVSEVNGTFDFEELPEFLFEEPFPCGIILRHPEDTPLLVSEAQFGEDRRVRVEIWGELHIRINDLSEYDVGRDVFFVLGLDRLLDELDFERALDTEDLVVYSDQPGASQDAAQVQSNFITAARIYLDPTPGDGEITADEQTPDNVVGNAQLSASR